MGPESDHSRADRLRETLAQTAVAITFDTFGPGGREGRLFALGLLFWPMMTLILVLANAWESSAWEILVGLLIAASVFAVVAGVVIYGHSQRRHAWSRLRLALDESKAAWPDAPVGDEDDDRKGRLASAWRTVRWLEQAHHLPRSVSVGIVSPGRFWMQHPPRIWLDGAQVGEGEEESGFDLWLDICAGTHLLELRAGKRCWRCQFILLPGDYVLEVGELTRTRVMLRTRYLV